MEQLEKVSEDAKSAIEKISTREELEDLRITYLGRNGIITNLLHQIKDLPEDQRPQFGKRANEIKQIITNLLEERIKFIDSSTKNQIDTLFDFTLTGKPYPFGHQHPLTQVMNEITEIFSRLGFAIAEGPDVETEYYNFEALNFPPNHPARDTQDTFYVKSLSSGKETSTQLLLRTHTSPVQIRVMEKTQPPVRIIVPGRVYRSDEIDASHSIVFHQVEGFAVDENITFADLKYTLTAFIKSMFGKETQARFRPSYFPFVEPGAEVDMTCLFCKGQGCKVCKQSGYLEILGAGMIHPNVFKYVNYDSEKYSGFAFGMGVERIAMLKYDINDMRLFYENDIRFLAQF